MKPVHSVTPNSLKPGSFETEETEQPLRDAGSDRTFYTGLVIVALALVSALATYLILTGLTPIVPTNEVAFSVLLTNIVLIAAMLGVIGWQVSGYVRDWRRGIAGAGLHLRIVALFTIITALPAVLLAVAATTTFSVSLDTLFSQRTRAIVESSENVAKNYLNEHVQVIRNDVVSMVRDLDAAATQTPPDSTGLQQLLLQQASLRELVAAYIINADGRPEVKAFETESARYVPPDQNTLGKAETGRIPLILSNDEFRIEAFAKLQNYPGKYLHIVRSVSPEVVGLLQRTGEYVAEYKNLRLAQGGLIYAHGLMYGAISMTSLLAAVWVGMWFAGRFVAPIRRLIGAAQQVSRGNMHVELPERQGEGDLRRLSRTFNTMTRELKNQRDALVAANEQLLERRRFMEAVLAGVSAGVMGLDEQDRITIASRSARTLLGVTGNELVGQPLREAVPAFAALMDRRDADGAKKVWSQDQVTLPINANERTFAVRFTREKSGEGDDGSVVTFDDITELVFAQRTSAWADVARRIAHEIKNPLTPIILAAERIRRKYGKVITEDRETFDKLTATIERQAGDIKSMVDEFAAFARVPKPLIEATDLREALQDPVILFRESHPQIDYELVMPKEPLLALVDRRLITQAITNLVKNATEAIETAAESAPNDWRGHIWAILRQDGPRVIIEVMDNGIGLPKQDRAKLLEPYVTTRTKGTGLGLAIVHRITEQHGGTMDLDDAPAAPGRPRGALVRMTLPLTPPPKDKPQSPQPEALAAPMA